MGMSPQSKAECDNEIARLERQLAQFKEQLASIKESIRNKHLYKGADDSIKVKIANTKNEIAALKAKRRSLK